MRVPHSSLLRLSRRLSQEMLVQKEGVGLLSKRHGVSKAAIKNASILAEHSHAPSTELKSQPRLAAKADPGYFAPSSPDSLLDELKFVPTRFPTLAQPRASSPENCRQGAPAASTLPQLIPHHSCSSSSNDAATPVVFVPRLNLQLVLPTLLGPRYHGEGSTRPSSPPGTDRMRQRTSVQRLPGLQESSVSNRIQREHRTSTNGGSPYLRNSKQFPARPLPLQQPHAQQQNPSQQHQLPEQKRHQLMDQKPQQRQQNSRPTSPATEDPPIKPPPPTADSTFESDSALPTSTSLSQRRRKRPHQQRIPPLQPPLGGHGLYFPQSMSGNTTFEPVFPPPPIFKPPIWPNTPLSPTLVCQSYA